MRRTRRSVKRSPSPASSDDEPLIKKTVNKARTKVDSKKTIGNKQTNNKNEETSSSDSDIADYLQDPNKMDLSSSFFQGVNKSPQSFEDIEKNIFSGVTRLSDSDSDDDNTTKNDVKKSTSSQAHAEPTKEQDKNSELDVATKLNFQQLQNYTKQIEEAKKQVEKYKSQKEASKGKKQRDDEKLDISLILSAEKPSLNQSATAALSSLHSSDFDSCSDSEKEWEEVAVKDSQDVAKKSDVPQDGLQITIELPHRVRKTKSVDLLTVMKRKLNRMRKENQVYIHKVHLLCWIAHGNFVNSAINNEKILGLSLSLLPSQNSYPSGRIDLSYLEQLLQWYKKAIVVAEKTIPKNAHLLELLETQISKKQVYSKKMLTYIFIALLRAVGVQCRLVLSFVVEPLRPPASDLHSLSTKQENVKQEDQAKPSEGSKQEKKIPVREKESKKNLETNVKQKMDSSKPVDKKPAGKSNTEKKISAPAENKRAKKDTGDANLKTSMANSRKGTDKIKSSSSTKTTKSSTSNSSSTKPTKSSNNKEKAATSKAKHVNKRPPPKPEIDKDKTPVEAKRTKTTEAAEKLTSGPVTRSRSTTPTNVCEPPVSSKRISSRAKNSLTQKNTTIKEKVTDTNPPDTQQSLRKRRSTKKEIKQIDGLYDSDSENSSCESSFQDDLTNLNYTALDYTYIAACNKVTIPQLDGVDDDKISTSLKPNLKKLRHKEDKSDTNTSVKGGGKSKKDADKDSKINLNKLKTKQVSRNVTGSGKPPKKGLVSEIDSEEEFTTQTRRTQNANAKPSPSTSKNTCKYFSSPSSSHDVRNDIMQLVKGRISQEKEKRRARRVKKTQQKHAQDGDSDYEPELHVKKHNDSEDEFVPKTKVKRRIPVKKSGDKLKVLSSDEDGDKSKKKKGVDVWAEVYLEDEEKWISVDIVRGEVHCVQQLFARATHPVSYIVAWNNDNSLKDITVRYCNNFNTATRKLRVENSWWQDSLKPFVGKKTARDKEEDEELAQQQLEKPLPTSIAEYKNHPLYVLKRHLLKFESIYPPDAPTLGFVRGEPVYSRDCVYTLHSREIWLKHAKVVKPGETPYKIVKARPKYDKLSNTVITDQMLEIFGPWQTEDYVPPTAENGIVPRNAYGNVELFKPCMLPKKTVYLKLPGLNRVAKKLDIDCAPAIVGFDFHSGWSHPTYDGFVVCEEFEDQLIAAWELEQEEIEKREQEKIDKRVYDNWKRLIKGLLIRERLKAKYDFSAGPSKKQKNPQAPKVVKKKRRMSDSD